MEARHPVIVFMDPQPDFVTQARLQELERELDAGSVPAPTKNAPLRLSTPWKVAGLVLAGMVGLGLVMRLLGFAFQLGFLALVGYGVYAWVIRPRLPKGR
ncbi:MAG: hypothetical protein OHK0012_25880 [Synechococcales cyanobacterium]